MPAGSGWLCQAPQPSRVGEARVPTAASPPARDVVTQDREEQDPALPGLGFGEFGAAGAFGALLGRVGGAVVVEGAVNQCLRAARTHP